MTVINSPTDISTTNVVNFSIVIRNSDLNVCAAFMNYTLHRDYCPFFFSLMPAIFILLKLVRYFHFCNYCRRRDFAQKAKSQESTLYYGKYLQFKYTVSVPEKVSICLNRGREKSVGNNDVSIVRARKYETVRVT